MKGLGQQCQINQQETYGCVDSVVLCEGEACSEERGKDSSEKHCSFSWCSWVVRDERMKECCLVVKGEERNRNRLRYTLFKKHRHCTDASA